MKKLFVMSLIFSIMFCACGTTGVKDETESQSISSETIVQSSETETEITQTDVQESESQTVQTEEPVDVEVSHEIRAMLPPMDGFMMYAAENEFIFDATNPEVFWGVLFYTVGNYAGNSQYAELDGDYLRVNRKFVQEYATGQFAEYSELPEIPEKWQNDIIYDTDWDAYKFSLGDRGTSAAQIVRCQEYKDGSYDVTARLFDLVENNTICLAKFHLVKNTYADGMEYPMFYYAIASVEKVNE